MGKGCTRRHWTSYESATKQLSAFVVDADLFHRRLSEKETDLEDKLAPSISYLQKLGPEYLDQIFESSRWVFQQDPDKAFEVIRPGFY